MGVAAQPAHPLQPRLGRPGRQAVVGAQALRLVGRGAGRWTGHDVPDFEAGQAARLRPARGREGRGRDPRRRSVRACRPTAAAGCSRPSGLVDGPLPTHYEPHESPVENALYGQRSNPVRQLFRRRENPYEPTPGQPGSDAYPYVVTTLPPDRAPHRRRDVADAGATCPSCSRRCSARSRPALAAERGLEHGGWATIVTAALGDRGAGDGDRPAGAAAGRRPSDPPGRAAVPLGQPRPGARRCRERPVPARARPERPHPGGEGGDVRHPSRPASARCGAARARRLVPARLRRATQP